MRFQTKDALDLFNFEEVTIRGIDAGADCVTVVMDALIAKGNNPSNEECEDRFVDTANVRFKDAHITKIIKEGYRYYDANGKLTEEKPDEEVSLMAYDSVLKKCKDVCLFDLIAGKDRADGHIYELGIDLNESDTCWITISCKETVVEWEKFMNRVMK